jgi:nucleoid-associated protein YgaU
VNLDESQLTKLTIQPYADQEFQTPVGPLWRALFNPTQLAYTRKNRYQNTKSVGASKSETAYVGGEPDQLQLDLFFDGTGVLETAEGVAARITSLLEPAGYQSDTHQPSYLRVQWGDYFFRGALTQADVTYTLLDREGRPLRATVKLTLQEVVAPQVRTAQERSNSPDLYQTWLVSDGDRIDTIAFQVYGDSSWWRPLAAANRLRNPRVLDVGSVLLLPPKAAG